MLKKTGPTGVVPVDADHDRWAYMRDGLVIWAGSREECERRLDINHRAAAHRNAHRLMGPKAIVRATRAI